MNRELSMEWILNPLTICAVTGIGLLALLFLWLSTRIEANKCRHDIAAIKVCTNSALQDLTVKVNEIMAPPAPHQEREYPALTHSELTHSALTQNPLTQSLN